MKQNSNKIVVITGASSGIGRELALILAARDYKVLAIARNEQRLQQLKAIDPSKIEIVSADIATTAGRGKVIKSIPSGIKVSHLVHNAAVMSPSGYLQDISVDKWRYQMAVNVESPLFLTQQLLPILHGGRVLNLTIYSSSRLNVGLGAYGISKAALNMLTQYYKLELEKYEIAVTDVLPGIVATDIQSQLPVTPGIAIADKVKRLRSEGKLLTPKVAAKFLSWLLLETNNDDFSKQTWDIYDTKHHKYWAEGLEVPVL